MHGSAGSTPRVVIAGGGLAGLTCAKVLAEGGLPVRLLERDSMLGGRASTFRDQDGDWIEQGLHLFHGGYSEFRELLRDIGELPRDVLYFTDHVRFEEPGGPRATFGLNPLYAPRLTLRSILGNNRYLGPLAKLALLPVVAPGVLPMALLRRWFDGITVSEWWRRVGGSRELLERVLRPFCRAIQFTDVEQFSAYDFLGWVHQTLNRPLRARLGGYRGARDQTIFRPLGAYLWAHGVEIRTGVELTEILYDTEAHEITGLRLASGETVVGDVYVVALPQWIFVDLMPEPLRDVPFFAKLARLPVAPAISVQLWLDRVVTEHDGYVLVPESHAPVYQDQSRITYPYASGSRLSVIVSPADALLGWSDAAIVDHVMATLGRANPRIAAAGITKSVVLRHPRHLIRPLPGAMSMRPRQRTPVANLFLAGDWTQQDFFGSQEGAVRGGNRCGRAILRSIGR